MHTRAVVIPKLLEIYLGAFDEYHHFSTAFIEGYLDREINTKITYFDLHYTYIYNHVLNIMNLVKDEPYAHKLVEMMCLACEEDCANDEYSPLCYVLSETGASVVNEVYNFDSQCPVTWTDTGASYYDL